eukprot:COSAG02_NODE_403_length_23058_cov_12.124134_15_plen_849_part_00
MCAGGHAYVPARHAARPLHFGLQSMDRVAETQALAAAAENVPRAGAVTDGPDTPADDHSTQEKKSCLAGQWEGRRRGQIEEFLKQIVDSPNSDGRIILSIVLGVPLVCAAVIFAVGTWVAIAVLVGLGACCSCAVIGIAGYCSTVWKQNLVIWLAIWFYGTLIAIVPAVLFASADEDAADAGASSGVAGVGCFIFSLWALGWALLWYRAPRIRPIEPEQHLLDMPPSWMLRLKFVADVWELYNYCGFSFFPALPWKAMEVPPSVPHPQVVMLAGFFDFGGVNTHFWTFVGATVTVPLGFILLLVYRKNPGAKFTVIQLIFELLSFPMIKTLSGVFSCTSADVLIDGSDPFCDPARVPMNAQCMDTDPSAVCWTSGRHRAYLGVAIVLLFPYYVACLQLQVTGYARQSVVIVDGTWSIIATQSKFILAVVASSFGDCYPIVMAVSVQAVVLSQLLLLYGGTVYSSVHSLNAIRVGGLLLGCVNGLFAVFVLYHYHDDPAGAAPCSTLEADGGSAVPSYATELRLVNDYGTFFALIAVNVLAVGCGATWYVHVARSWIKSDNEGLYGDLASVNSSTSAKEVDYPIVKARLEAAKWLLAGRSDSSTPFVFDLYTIEPGSGQQIERVTLNMVLKSEALVAPNGVRLLGIDVSEKNGLMVLDWFETMHGKPVRSRSTCWLPCCEKKHGIERSWKTCWYPKDRAMAEVDVTACEFIAVDVEVLRKLRKRLKRAQCSRQVWHAAVKGNKRGDAECDFGSTLYYAPVELQADSEIVLAAVQRKCSSLLCASVELRKDREFMLKAVKEDPTALEYASAELLENREFMLKAVKDNPAALEYASAELLDAELRKVAGQD